MKSFNQFLQESYLNEEDARQGKLFTSKGTAQNFTNPKRIPFTGTDPTPTPASRRLPAGAPEAPRTSPGQLSIPEPTTTKVSGSQFRNAGEARQGSLFTKSGKPQNFTGGRTPFVGTDPVKATKRLPAAAPEAPKASPGQQVIRQNSTPPSRPALPPGNPGGKLAKPINAIPDAMARGAQDAARRQASNIKPPALPSSATSAAAKEAQKATTKTATKTAAKGILRTLGRVAGPASAALDVADERSKGSGWVRSLAKGAVVAAGGALGGAAGSAVAPGAGTLVGATGGAMAASKAFDVAAGANAVERKAMATANRQRQAGTAVKGIGGKTTFSQAKSGGPAFMSTGSGSQRKTVQLAKTGVVHRGGQSVAGYLAKKDGKAVYKAGPDPSTLAKTSSNWLERVGRTVAKGAYKAHDAKQAAKKLATARASDAARNKALGVKAKPAG